MGPMLQFPGDVYIPDNGAGDQLREEGDISAKRNDILLRRHIAPVHIDGIA